MPIHIRTASSARKHGLSRSRIEQAMNNQIVSETLNSTTFDPKIRFIGVDDRGEELEVVAVVLPRLFLIIHAMPTRYRRSSR
jgi:hypothetical protein